MELAARTGDDRFVPAGAYLALEQRVRRRRDELAELPAVVFSAFDRRTRLLPFVLYDSLMFPAGAAAIAGALHAAGFDRTRAVFQLWNRHVRPSRAGIDGRAAQMVLVSSMQIHSRPAYDLIADAHRLGADRPLVIAGGAKAIYEPYDFWAGPHGAAAAPDVVVTGESYVLMDLLAVIQEYRGRADSLRQGFERARHDGALESVPGLVYRAPDATVHDAALIDTGLQRLVRDLDDCARQAVGLGLLEPPHWRTGLAEVPLADARVVRHTPIASLVVTQGCRFRCSYCPIPAANQRSWRHRSPDSLVDEIRRIHERFGVKYFFGADDNFFNYRATAETLLRAMAGARVAGRPFGERIRFGTEATQADTYKHRDLLLLGREAGLRALWFGIEDLTATMVNKGQKPAVTVELFRIMRQLKIAPMAMMIFHGTQPFRSDPPSLYGLANQIAFLREAGAVTVQCTAHLAAVGTREFDGLMESRRVISHVNGRAIDDVLHDGNHVTMPEGEQAWKRQLQLLAGYAVFYNPLNLLRALGDRSPLRKYYIGYQVLGLFGLAWTAVKSLRYALRLLPGRLEFHSAVIAPTARVQHPAGAVHRTLTVVK